MSDDKLVDCPHCSEPQLERLLGGGGAGFVLKGAGFYQNDYKSSGQDSEPKTHGGDSGPAGGG